MRISLAQGWGPLSVAARRGVLLVACVVGLAAGGWLVLHDSDPTIVATPKGGVVTRAPKHSAVVWAVGDGDGRRNAAAVARRIRGSRPDLFLYLGDVYPDGTPGDFRRDYRPTYGRLARRTLPTPGNHDWPEATDGYYPYWRRATGKPMPAFYSLRIAGWEILSLNSQAPHGRHSAQLRWLRRRLRGSGTCRLAFWHRARFSAGTVHGDQPDVAPLWRALRGRARVVLNGHDHDSQRLRRVDGITEFVAGAGGHGLYPLDKADRRLAFADASHYAALRLKLRPGAARYAFISSAGRTLDRGRVRCSRR